MKSKTISECKVDLSAENEKNFEVKRSQGWRRFTGIICALITSILYVCSLTIAKKLEGRFHPLEILIYREIGAILLAVFLMSYFILFQELKIRTVFSPIRENYKVIFSLCLSGMLIITNLTFKLWSIKYLSVEDSLVVFYSGPLLIMILSYFILKERLKISSFLIGIFMLSGVILIARPPFLTSAQEYDYKHLIGTLLMIGAVLTYGLGIILVRKTRVVHFSVSILIYALVAFVQCLIVGFSLGAIGPLPSNYEEILMLGALTVLLFLSQMFMILSMKFEDAGVISLIRVTDVFWSFLLTHLILEFRAPDSISLGGAVILLIGFLATSLQKYLELQNKDHWLKKKLWCCMK